MPRCAWCSDDPLYIDYHDNEWGVPTRDPQVLFEFLILEAFQAGLSWITVLRKRERYREVLFGFDPLHRYQSHGNFALVWNAILHWNDLGVSES